ncbi:MAG: RluA family pseudouridine synthase [Elainellaceae cyanobacterium]
MHEQARLFTLAQFGVRSEEDYLPQVHSSAKATYWYEGVCPSTGERLTLPRTPLAEAVARGLLNRLAEADSDRGKMYGILLVDTPVGCRVLKASSGRFKPSFDSGWVPNIPEPAQLTLSELQVISELDAIKKKLIVLLQLSVRKDYELQAQAFSERLTSLAEKHRRRKADRQQKRQLLLGDALADLDDESRRDGIERKLLKRERDRTLGPLKQAIDDADAQIQVLKRRRRRLSQQLQAQMHASYTLTNFAGEQLTLSDVILNQGIPTGTGECCAPKLLHYAAIHGFEPLAMAEFWWGEPSASGGRVPGAFYGACAERCQPIMGFLLSGLPAAKIDAVNHKVKILYEDDWLIAVDKPAGLLSTPGRSVLNPNSAASQVQAMLCAPAYGIHRLDQETSGVLLFARSPQIHQQLSDQFRQRQVSKCYEALVTAAVTQDYGAIDLPIGRYPDCRPKRRVDYERGKPSHTKFKVIERREGTTRLELTPTTGRTHQLRVHLSAAEGLRAPILGDRVYGGKSSQRLHLHARALTVWHPKLEKALRIVAETPF